MRTKTKQNLVRGVCVLSGAVVSVLMTKRRSTTSTTSTTNNTKWSTYGGEILQGGLAGAGIGQGLILLGRWLYSNTIHRAIHYRASADSNQQQLNNATAKNQILERELEELRAENNLLQEENSHIMEGSAVIAQELERQEWQDEGNASDDNPAAFFQRRVDSNITLTQQDSSSAAGAVLTDEIEPTQALKVGLFRPASIAINPVRLASIAISNETPNPQDNAMRKGV